jgi:BlaI family penicillinase repressor
MSTILNRMSDKGYLTKELRGNVNFYDAALTFQEYQKHETQGLLAALYGGNVKNFVAALVDDEGVSREDIEDLKRWFEYKAGGGNE